MYRGTCGNCRNVTYWWNDNVVSTTGEVLNAIMVITEGSANAPHAHLDMPPVARTMSRTGTICARVAEKNIVTARSGQQSAG